MEKIGVYQCGKYSVKAFCLVTVDVSESGKITTWVHVIREGLHYFVRRQALLMLTRT